jgi:sensor histidine kinase YesM
MSRSRKLFAVFLQIVLWSAFVALPYFMVPRPNEQQNPDAVSRHFAAQPDMAQNIFLSSLAFNICLIVFFYLHQYVLFNRLVVKRRFGLYLTVITGIFLLIFFVSYTYRTLLFPSLHYHPLLSFREIVRALTWYLLVLLISLGLKLLGQWRQAEERAHEVENDQLRTELSFLHAQINPHFLFNSLNTIYSLALQKSDTAPGAVIKLSQLLRYVVDEAGHNQVTLSREVDYLNNYIELQKLRSTSTLAVHFKVTGDIQSTQIAPLLLLPFVENAFKYGISSHDESPIDIALCADTRQINFSVKNRNYDSDSYEIERHSSGIGINNVRRRLELLYSGKHKLDIDNSQGLYFIKLTIQLK